MSRYWILALALALGYLSSTAFGQYGSTPYGSHFGPSAFPPRTQAYTHVPSYAPVHATPHIPAYSVTSQQPVPTNSHVRSHAILNSVPTVPQGFDAHQPTSYGIIGPSGQGQYHLAGTQQQIYSGGIADPHPAPTPAPSVMHSSPMTSVPSVSPAPQAHMQHSPAITTHVPAPHGPAIASHTNAPSAGCQSCAQSAAPMMSSDYVIDTTPGCATCSSAPISGYYSEPCTSSSNTKESSITNTKES